LDAYETLKDARKRAQYDALRRASFDSSQAFDVWAGTGYARQRAAAHDWERQFDEWMRRMRQEFGEFGADSERIRQERASDERVARAEAWEREKKEAKEIRLRSARVKRRAEDAEQARRAAVLRRFWQAHPGFTWQDAAVGSIFVLSSVGLALYWRGVVKGNSN
jgi:curved DNA-binding protein CbpA